ncbi:hypothetical protein [Streptomyces armeniacus]|nr:hypothetical protein [Streptomyces armeniacus]
MTTTEHRTRPHPDPVPDALTGTRAKIFEALTAHPGSTTADLAQTAAVGRSTAGKALTALEDQGLAVREPGDRTPGHRTPDRWRPAPHTAPDTPHPANEANNAAPGQEDNATPASATNDEHADTTESHTTPQGDDAPAARGNDENPDGPTHPDQDPNHGESTSAATEAQEDGSVETPGASPTAAPSGTEDEAPSEAHRTTGHPVAPTPVAKPGRLQPGALREMVVAHLQANPDTAYTATGISRIIDRSSGAIANALVKLTAQGTTRQVSDAPRRYQYTARGPQEN